MPERGLVRGLLTLKAIRSIPGLYPNRSYGRAGKKRGKQPLWLQTVMRYHIQPVVKRLGTSKRISWHTFRRTFAMLLKANGKDIKVVQELLRHGSTRVTLDIYAQAQMPAKRAAQLKVVEMVRAQPVPLAV